MGAALVPPTSGSVRCRGPRFGDVGHLAGDGEPVPGEVGLDPRDRVDRSGDHAEREVLTGEAPQERDAERLPRSDDDERPLLLLPAFTVGELPG